MKSLPFLLVIPLLAQQGVNFSSLEKERALGEALAAEIRRESEPLSTPEMDAYVARLQRELIAHLKDAPFDYRFEAIVGGVWTEPFSLPGGRVFLPARAFVAAQEEAEFVGMVAHAIGHSALRHGTRMATRGQMANLASIPVFFGGTAGSHAQSQNLTVPMGFLKFQREYELEADRFGVELAARAGYDAAAYERYVSRTQPADSKMSPLPPRTERLERLRDVLSSLSFFYGTSTREDFQRAREAAQAMLDKLEQRRVPTLRRGAPTLRR